MNTFCRILEKYGEDTIIVFGDKKKFARSFIQPVVRSGETRVSHLGKVNDGEYYWFAPGHLALEQDAKMTVSTSDGTFDVVRVEKFRVFGRVSHWEGILKRRY